MKAHGARMTSRRRQPCDRGRRCGHARGRHGHAPCRALARGRGRGPCGRGRCGSRCGHGAGRDPGHGCGRGHDRCGHGRRECRHRTLLVPMSTTRHGGQRHVTLSRWARRVYWHCARRSLHRRGRAARASATATGGAVCPDHHLRRHVLLQRMLLMAAVLILMQMQTCRVLRTRLGIAGRRSHWHQVLRLHRLDPRLARRHGLGAATLPRYRWMHYHPCQPVPHRRGSAAAQAPRRQSHDHLRRHHWGRDRGGEDPHAAAGRVGGMADHHPLAQGQGHPRTCLVVARRRPVEAAAAVVVRDGAPSTAHLRRRAAVVEALAAHHHGRAAAASSSAAALASPRGADRHQAQETRDA